MTVSDGRLRLEPAADAERGKVLFITIASVMGSAPSIPPTVVLAEPTVSTTHMLGQAINIVAEASDSDGQVERVEFYAGSARLGEDLTAPYGMEWTPSESGEYALTAVATDDAGLSTTSEAVSVVVAGSESDFSAAINFQPAGVAVPAGYEADTGLVFGDRGNGLSYGWDRDISSDARDRNSSVSPDQRYDTLNHTVFYGRVGWEIAVPNGDYEVTVAVGEPSWAGQSVAYRMRMLADGVEVVDAMITGSEWYGEGTATVTVSDGRLRLEPAADAERGKVLFIQVSSLDRK